MKNYGFYAVIDDNGLVSAQHPNYENLKMIFSSKEEAVKVLENNPLIRLRVVHVKIIVID